MRLSRVSLLLPVVTAFQLAPLRALPRAGRSFVALTAGSDKTPQPADDVKVTIRKRSGDARPALQEDSPVFVANFGHVKKSLSTFLKFWLMGGCGELENWVGTGELEAQHTPSGTTASIEVDVEQATVSLLSPSASSMAGNQPLGEYAIALLDELESLAKSEEVAPPDRLCWPAEAVDSVRLAAWAACAPRETQANAASPSGGESDGGGSETEFERFLKSLKKE